MLAFMLGGSYVSLLCSLCSMPLPVAVPVSVSVSACGVFLPVASYPPPPPLLSQQPGDAVAEDEVLVDVSFESFDVEIVAEQSGFLAQILVGTYMTWKLIRV